METIIVLNSSSTGKVYILSLKESIENQEITLVSHLESFSCKITTENMKKFAKSYEMDTCDYKSTLLELLTTQSDEPFVELKNQTFTLYKTKASKVVFFSAPIKQINHVEAQAKCLEIFLKKNSAQKDTISALKSENNELQTELEKYKEKLDSWVDSNLERENLILTCFVQVLNEKKRYIQFLKNFLSQNDEVLTEEEFKNQQSPKKRPASRELSDSESSTQSNMDNQEEIAESRGHGSKQNVHCFDSNDDFDSLMDDLEDENRCETTKLKLPKRTETTNKNTGIVKTQTSNENLAVDANSEPVATSDSQKCAITEECTPQERVYTQDLLDEL